MNKSTYIIIVAILCTFVGCGSTKRLYGTTETTTTIEVRDREVEVQGVTQLEIEAQEESAEIELVIVPPPPLTEGDSLPEESPPPPQPQIEDCYSELENEYSRSRAEIKSGVLLHTLEQKEQVKEVPFEATVTVQDSLKKEVTATLDYVEVPRDLTWWQETQMRGFWILLMVILGYIAIKRFIPFA